MYNKKKFCSAFQGRFSRMKLFILDSNKRTLAEAEAYFEKKEDIEIVGVSDNGVDGINGIIGTDPDVVVIELMLSKIDGIEVLRGIEDLNIKVIVTTAMQSDNVINKVFSLGVDYVLLKPYSLDILYNRILDVTSPIRISDEGYKRVIFDHEEPDVIYADSSITKLLHDVGITPNLKGFRYLRTAIGMVITDETIIEAVTKVLYPEIAKIYKTTSVRAERAIRHAIESSWNKDNGALIKRLFLLPQNAKRPTNSEFIGIAAEYLKELE